MQNYIIATSSTCDLPRTFLEEHNIPLISYTYTIGNEVFEDDCREESRQAVYEGMRKGDRLKTSMINEFIYYEFFKSLVEQGNDVIFLDMSEKMSVSYANSIKAADMIHKEFPDRKFTVMDTRCISVGLGMLLENMVRLKEAGKSYDEVLQWGEDNKLKIAHRFTVDDLNYLKAGGRVSNSAALVGSLLSVKPVLYVPDVGTLEVAKKVRGRKNALKTIYEGVKHDLSQVDCKGLRIRIAHADCLQDAETLEGFIKADFPEVGEIIISNLGVVIGAHTGPGLLAVFYLCNGRNAE